MLNDWGLRNINYRLVNTAWWVLALLILLVGILTLAQGLSIFDFPYVVSRNEAFVADGAFSLLRGEPLYPEITPWQYRIHVYNPLTYLPAAWLGSLAGSYEAVLSAGRLISVVSGASLALLVGYWCWIKGGARAAILGGGVVLLMAHMTMPDFMRFRPEPLAVFFSIAAWFYIASEYQRGIAVAAVLCFLAFMVKQSFIAVPAALCVYWAYKKQWRKALLFALIMALFLSVFFLSMYLLNGVGYFQNALISMGVNEVSPVRHFKIYAPIFFKQTPGFFVAALFALLWLALNAKNEERLLVSIIVIGLWTFYSAGKAGASDNYFAEFTVLVIMAITVASASKNMLVSCSILMALLAQLLFSGWMAIQGEFYLKAQYEDVGMDVKSYVERYKNNSNLLILEEKVAVQSGRGIGYDWYLLDILSRKGMVDLNPFFQSVRNGKYEMVIFDQNPVSAFQRALYDEVKRGPYIRTMSNQYVSEWTRLPR